MMTQDDVIMLRTVFLFTEDRVSQDMPDWASAAGAYVAGDAARMGSRAA